MGSERDREALDWQIGVWDRMSETYVREIDRRFVPVIDQVLTRAGLQPGHRALDLGTGTGSVALRASPLVMPGGHVLAVDLSREMLAVAGRRVRDAGAPNVTFREGRAEAIPAESGTFDRVLASLSLMFAIDRETAAGEIARVLRPAGRLVAAVWAGPERCDIVRFQQIAASFAPAPPVPRVGPGGLADPAPFVARLAEAGIDARVDTVMLGFDFDDFASAWNVLAGVTAAGLPPARQEEAKAAVRASMWPRGDGPRHFANLTQFIIGDRRV
jgi:SAM-dependent methyltransferase